MRPRIDTAVLLILWIALIILLMVAAASRADAHTPPPTPNVEAFCLQLEELDNCEEWYHDLIEGRLAQIAEDAHRRIVSVRRPTDTTYRGMGSDVEAWRSLVAAYFPADQVDRALCVMSLESGGNPNAKNPTSSARGLFQILASLWAPHFGVTYEQLYNPETNVSIARKVYDIQGWWAWSPYKRGNCR